MGTPFDYTPNPDSEVAECTQGRFARTKWPSRKILVSVAIVVTAVVLTGVALSVHHISNGGLTKTPWKEEEVRVGAEQREGKKQTSNCSKIVPLVGCKRDQGPQEPGNLQTVYLGSTYAPGWWRYPTSTGWLGDSQHDTRTITETEHSWAKWIWHDCRDGYVCLESVKYPNYYLYRDFAGTHGIAYSTAPELQWWARMKVTRNSTDHRGFFIIFVSEQSINDGITEGLPAHVYIPPRCEGYVEVFNHSNESPDPIDYKYKYERGITKMEKTTVTMKAGLEVMNGIIMAATKGNFSMTWISEKSKAISDKPTYESSITIPAGKRVIVWQKTATYGLYNWGSGIDLIRCIKDV